MFYVVLTVACYLCFNVGVWMSTLGQSDLAVGFGYLLGCLAIRLRFANQIRAQSNTPIQWPLVLGCGVSILITVSALRYAHSRLPLSLSMEAIYNGLAMASWPTFLMLNWFWPQRFKERPKWFDLLCHLLMFLLVALRFSTYGAYHLDGGTIMALAAGASGYIGVNLAVMLIAGHRLSNILGIALAAVALLCWQITNGASWHWNGASIGATLLIALASYGIPVYLTAAYAHFKQLASLVPPLVYDSLLVASPLVMIVRGEMVSHWTVLVAAGMVIVTVIRYRYHTR